MTLLEEFDARDEDGNIYRLQAWQLWINAGNISDPDRRIPGRKRMTLLNGDFVEVLDENNFTITNTGVHVTRVN